jgi:lipoprotein Spr
MNHFKQSTLFFLFVALIMTSCSSLRKASKLKKSEGISTKEQLNSTKSSFIRTKYSTLLNTDENNITNLSLYSLIDEWYGTSYKYGGCDKNGIDCSNFVSVLYQQLYHIPLTGSSATIFTQCKTIAKKELQEGDLVFFTIENNRISHMGMYLQNNKFVHATTKKGVMIDDLDEPYYLKYFYKAGRLKQ